MKKKKVKEGHPQGEENAYREKLVYVLSRKYMKIKVPSLQNIGRRVRRKEQSMRHESSKSVEEMS